MAQVIISHLPPLPNGTGTGIPKGTDLTPATDTTDTTEAASGTTKKYTRSREFNYYLTAQGYVCVEEACRVATATALTATYLNGTAGVGATLTNAGAQTALVVDGVTMAVGDRVLVKQQASSFQNGIYTVTTVGSGSVNWVMTRATDYDEASDIVEDQVILVNQGTTYAGRAFQETSPSPSIIGTSPITFALMGESSNIGFTWITVTSTSEQMTANNGYIASNGSLVSLPLPLTSEVGDEIKIVGQGAGGWKITQQAAQQIHVGDTASTLGAAGSVASVGQYDSIYLVCTVSSTIWTAVGGPQSAGLTIL
jgi:hypothetical protein